MAISDYLNVKFFFVVALCDVIPHHLGSLFDFFRFQATKANVSLEDTSPCHHCQDVTR